MSDIYSLLSGVVLIRHHNRHGYHLSNYDDGKRLERHVTIPLPSWFTNPQARVLFALRNMLPHDYKIIEGVTVETKSRSAKIAYFVSSEEVEGSLDDVAEYICKVAKEKHGG